MATTTDVFDVTTAYNKEYRFLPPQLVHDVRIERRSEGNTLRSWCNAKAWRFDINRSDFVTIATALQANAEDTIWNIAPLAADADPIDPLYDACTPPDANDLILFDLGRQGVERWNLNTVAQNSAGAKWTVTATKIDG